MLESEVLEILAQDPERGGEELNQLADEFRSGRRDISQLVPLLDAEEPELVWAAAWILGEVAYWRYDTVRFIDRLYVLLGHPKPSVRFQALGALFPAFDRDDSRTREVLARLRTDENSGVRTAAEAAARRLGLA